MEPESRCLFRKDNGRLSYPKQLKNLGYELDQKIEKTFFFIIESYIIKLRSE